MVSKLGGVIKANNSIIINVVAVTQSFNRLVVLAQVKGCLPYAVYSVYPQGHARYSCNNGSYCQTLAQAQSVFNHRCTY